MGSFLDYVNSQKKTKSTKQGNFGRYVTEKKIGLDTLETDLASASDLVNRVYSGWHSADDMKSSRQTVSAMRDRLTAYRGYANDNNSGQDLAEFNAGMDKLIGAYDAALGDWDALSAEYARYADADSYGVARKNAERYNKYKGLDFDGVQKAIKENPDDAEFLSHYGLNVGYADKKDVEKEIGIVDYYIANSEGAEQKTWKDYRNRLYETTKNPNALFKGSEAFADGYQPGDVLNTVGATAADVFVRGSKGIASALEGLGDFATYGVSGLAGLVGADGVSQYLKDLAKQEMTQDLYRPYYSTTVHRDSLLGGLGTSVAEGVGQMGFNLATVMMGSGAGLGNLGTEILSKGALFSSAAGNSMSEAYNNGATDGEAVAYGLLSGAVETGSEMMFGGLGKAVNSIGLNRGIAGFDDMLAKKIGGKINNFVLRNAAEMGIKATGEGVEEVVAGLGNAVAKKLTYMSDEDLGKLVKDEELLNQFLVGTLSSAVTQTPSLVQSYKYGTDYVTNRTAAEEFVITSDYEARLAEAEKDGKKLSNREKDKLYLRVEEDLTAEQKKVYESAKRNAPNAVGRVASMDVSDTVDNATGAATKVQGIRTDDSGNTVLKTSAGERSIDSVTLNRRDAEVVAMAEGMEPSQADLFVSMYSGQDTAAYKDSFDLAYAYGKNAYGVDNAIKRRGVLTEDQALKVYKLGISERTSSQQKQIDAITEKHFADSGKMVEGKFDDTGVDYTKLNSRQKAAASFAKMFSKATGVNVVLFESKADENGVRKAENGRYESGTNTIYIDVYAGFKENEGVFHDSMIPTMSHELTHWMKEKAPEAYAKLSDIVMDTLSQHHGARPEVLVAAEKKRHKDKDRDVSDEYAQDELIARACEDMLSGNKTAEEIIEKMDAETAKTFSEKFKEMVAKIRAWLKDLLKAYKSNSEEATILRRYDDKLAELQKAWDEAFAKAMKANQALQNGNTDAVASSDRSSRGKMYSYEYITSKPDMNLTYVESVGEMKRADIVREALSNVKENGFTNENGNAVVHVNDIGKDIIVPKHSITHGMDRRFSTQAPVLVHIGEVLKNAIRINELNPRSENIGESYILLGAARGEDSFYVVSFVVNSYTGEVDKIEVLYSANVKMEPAAFLPTVTDNTSATPTDSTISISNLLDIVNKHFADLLPEDVLKHFGYDRRPEGKVGKDALYSDRDSAGNGLTGEQVEFFKDSKIRDENGNLLVMYHGTGRADRVGYHFREDRATSGPMAFFTDNKSVADNYAKDKQDTSLAYDERYRDYYTQFRIEVGGKDMSITEAWDKLPVAKKVEIRKKAPHVTFDDDMENIVYNEDINNGTGGFDKYRINEHNGNYLAALVDEWLEGGTLYGQEKDFLTVLSLAGLDDVQYMDPDMRDEKTYQVYLNVKNPFDTTNISADMVQAFKDAADRTVYEPGAGADTWDKRNIRPEQWIERLESDIANGTTYVWTSIPDFVTDVLKAKGYDGIVDKGGKQGGSVHTVVIPFYSNQVKDITNQNPTENEDIRYSNRDSEGNGLTKEQIEFFKESKVRDAEGNLLVMYHGTMHGGFNVFRNERRPRTEGFYFTKDRSVSNVFEGIDNRTGKYYESVQEGVDDGSYSPMTYEVYLNIKNPLILKMEQQDIIEDIGYWESIYSPIREKGYDGVILEDFSQVFVFSSNQIKSTGNLTPTENPDIRYSDRQTESIYDAVGELKRIQRENDKLKADIERLRKKNRLERTVTGGRELNESHIAAVAGRVLKLADSRYSRTDLASELKGIYEYLQGEDVAWDVFMSKATDLAQRVVAEARERKVTDDYAKMILSTIRSARISLNDTQKAEAEYAYGKNWNRSFFGRVTIANDGIPLESVWSEWATMYPDVFDADISDADMVTALLDIYDSTRTASEVVETYDKSEAARALAFEIYNQFWNVAPVRTLADKHDKEVKRLKFEHRQEMKELRERKDAEVFETKWHYSKLIHKVRQQREEKIAELKKESREYTKQYREKIERRNQISQITKKSLKLNTWLKKNSKDEHIVEELKAPVAAVLRALDFSSERFLGTGVPTQKDISLKSAFEHLYKSIYDIDKRQGEDDYSIDMPVDYVEFLESMKDQVNGIVERVGDNEHILRDMTLEQLQDMNKMLSVLTHIVTSANKALADANGKAISTMAQSTMLYANDLGPKSKKVGAASDFFNFDNGLPVYVFKMMGEGGQRIFRNMQDGWDKMAFHVKQIVDYSKDCYDAKEVKEWSKEIHEFTFADGSTVQMTTAQIMSLYCLQKREQARLHLLKGGMRVADFKVGTDTITNEDGVLLLPHEIDKVVSALTGRQKKVADGLQLFMNTVCSDWGNEVSMRRFGIKSFGEENYFPIQSDASVVTGGDTPKTDRGSEVFRLLNMDFTKALNAHANNRIVVDNIFDVFATHTSDMAKYNALALPVLDMFRWYNYKESYRINPEDPEDTRMRAKSLKQSLRKAYGDGSTKYIMQFMKDINGAHSGGMSNIEKLGRKMISNYKVAAVGANIRVAILQPTSYVRASAVIDPKYLTAALAHKPQIQKAKDTCGIALWKSLGFYDTNISRGVASLIKHDERWYHKAREISMKLAEWGDAMTWGYLYNACEAEIKATQPGLTGDAKDRAVADRLREVIYATQVVDSTMTRTQNMRNPSTMNQIMTSFMSEPSLSYNLLHDLYIQYNADKRQIGKSAAFRKNGKHIARVTASYLVTLCCASLAGGFIDTIRDDEDEEEFFEKLLSNAAENAVSDALSMLPVIKDAVSIYKGFNVGRMDMQGIQSSYYAFRKLYKAFTEGEWDYKTVYSLITSVTKAVSQNSGLPASNLLRDVTAIWNSTIGEVYESLKIK